MKISYKKTLMWGVAALFCFFLLSVRDMSSYAEESGERSNVVIGAAEGDYELSDKPGDETDESSGSKKYYVEGVKGGPGVKAEAADDEETEEEADGSVFYMDGAAYIKGDAVGNFRLSGYCGCDDCGGSGMTYSGTEPRAKHTVAADLSRLPIGTKIIIEGSSGSTVHNFDGIYEVEDRGSGVNGDHIDIYFDTHEEARSVTDPGWQYSNVWIAIPADAEQE